MSFEPSLENFKKMHMQNSLPKRQSFILGLHVLQIYLFLSSTGLALTMGHHKSKMSRRGRKSARPHSLFAMNLEEVDINGLMSTEDYDNVTPLWLATRYNDLELAITIINLGAKVSVQSGNIGMTPLHMAAYVHSVEMVELLLEAGADPNIMDRWNFTPLMYAAIYHEADVVERLFQVFLAHGCDVNHGQTLTSHGKSHKHLELPELRSRFDGMHITYMREPLGPTSGTALHLAVQNPHLSNDVISILLEAGAKVNEQNIYGQTPLIGALMDVFYDYHSNIKAHADLILREGCDVNKQDVRGWSPLHYACQRGNINSIRTLVSAGADSNLVSNMQETALWVLLGYGWQDAARFIVCNGCDVNHCIKSSVILLMNQGCDLCRYGDIAPIEFAMCNRYYSVAELLIRSGCRLTSRTWLGSQLEPLNNKHGEIVRLARLFMSNTRVKSLKNFCRVAIRAHMDQGILLKVVYLDLPQSLKDYICFKT